MTARALLLSLLSALTLGADVTLPALISNHMVLQQESPIRLWGKADPGENVIATFRGNSASVMADTSGRWSLRLPKQHAGGPFSVGIQGKNTITVEDVLVGEVWVGSGQSNMSFVMAGTPNATQEMAAANEPQIHFFRVKIVLADEPASDVAGAWEVTSPETVGRFSAVGYFFARDLNRALKVPVGIIQSALGGTPAEAWTSRPALAAQEPLRHFLSDWEKMKAELPQRKAEFDQKLADWKLAADEAKRGGRPEPTKPSAPRGPGKNLYSVLYNGMIAPLTEYAIGGVIWYQGERNTTNSERAREYNLLFRTMIQDWRQAWQLGDFPFLWVQLAGYRTDDESDWPLLRESQNAALALKRTGTAVAIDIGEEKDIHPKNKQEVGRRLALVARVVAYREKIEYSGPVYQSMKLEGDAIHLRFTHAKGGLKAKGGELQGFVIAGQDHKFVPAIAEIKGSTLTVRANGVQQPAAVRYGWDDWTPANLYNAAELPASPFRTDDWKETGH